jgi:hypothetical protein
MKKIFATMMLIVSASTFAEGGNTTLYGGTRYCVPSAGGSAAACGAIVNGASVSCELPPATGCNIPGVGSGNVDNKIIRKELQKR